MLPLLECWNRKDEPKNGEKELHLNDVVVLGVTLMYQVKKVSRNMFSVTTWKWKFSDPAAEVEEHKVELRKTKKKTKAELLQMKKDNQKLAQASFLIDAS